MDINEKYQAQLKMLTNALIDFKKSLDADMGKYDELEQNWIKNAQIQKFEFCIEDRNKLSHIYKLEMFESMASNLGNNFNAMEQTNIILQDLSNAEFNR